MANDDDTPLGLRPFDNLFKSNRRWPVKVGGAGVFGLVFAGVVLLAMRKDKDMTPAFCVATLIAMPAICMLIAGVLVWSDVIHHRQQTNEHVRTDFALLFRAGIWSWPDLVFPADGLDYFAGNRFLGSLTAGHAHQFASPLLKPVPVRPALAVCRRTLGCDAVLRHLQMTSAIRETYNPSVIHPAPL